MEVDPALCCKDCAKRCTVLFRVPATQEADITCSTTNDITAFDDALHVSLNYWPILRNSSFLWGKISEKCSICKSVK